MTRTKVSLDSDMYEQAREEANRQGISFAELCRRALGQFLRQQPRADQPWLRFAGVVEAGGPDASQSVDEVVYDRDRP